MRRAALAVVALVASLPSVEAARAQDADRPLDDLASRNAQFACDLFRAVGGSGGNLFLSPHSVSTALAMARAGAAGETARQMDAVLHLPLRYVVAFRDLTSAIGEVPARPDARLPGQPRGPEVPAYVWSLASGVFAQRGWPYLGVFRGTVGNYFLGEFQEVDFEQRDEGGGAIERWVREKTKGRVQDLVPEGVPASDARLVLVGAVHFGASWREPFPEDSTTRGPFRVGSRRSVQVLRMRRTATFAYAESGGEQVLEIPYRDGAASMVVVLPKAEEGLDALVKGLEAGRFHEWLDALRPTSVSVELPRFSVASRSDLAPALAHMGMADAFDAAHADFSGISGRKPLSLGAVLHKASVAVDEKGTQAPTAPAPTGTTFPRSQAVPFVVDHPFLVAIRHQKTGAVLFLGRVVDPTAK